MSITEILSCLNGDSGDEEILSMPSDLFPFVCDDLAAEKSTCQGSKTTFFISIIILHFVFQNHYK